MTLMIQLFKNGLVIYKDVASNVTVQRPPNFLIYLIILSILPLAIMPILLLSLWP